MNRFQLGQIVYHRDVYSHTEPLKIVGIRETELELEGDYSGGTHGVSQKQWMSVKGVSRIYNHKYKEIYRKRAIRLLGVSNQPTEIELIQMIMSLTTDISLNPEY